MRYSPAGISKKFSQIVSEVLTQIHIKGQVIITQLKSLDFKERKLKKIENLPLQDMAKIDQIIQYMF